MRGVSEERLNELKDNDCYSGIEQSIIYELLSDECKELNPWLPIDENTPRTRKILLSYGIGKQQVVGWITNTPEATHYQELPSDPIDTSIKK